MLEQHLRQAYLLLQSHAQHHPRADPLSLKPVLDILNFGVAPSGSPNSIDWQDDLSRGSNINSMLAGCRRLISSPPWNTSLYGPLSETAFILRTLEIFNLDRAGVRQALLPILGIFDLPFPTAAEPEGPFSLPHLSLPWTPNHLPNKDDATRLLDTVFKRTHPFLGFLHEPSFCSMVTILYGQSPEENDTRTQFLPLFHHAIALGYLWDRDWHRQRGCDVAMDSAMFHFKIGQKLLDTTQLDSLVSLQALLCSAIFLISTSRISRAYAFLGLASSTAIRLGLHCDVTSKPNIAWQERSMRIAAFISLGRLDLYASLVLDLPALLPDTVLDTGINTVYATLGHCGTREVDNTIEASIQHLELLRFTSTTRRAVFTDVTTGEAVESIDSNLLGALDERLRHWTQKISHLLAQVTQQERNSEMSRHLEMACNFAQLSFYRPFLPYLRIMAEGKAIPLSHSRHALACIKLASTTITRLESNALAMPDVLLSWDTTYTLFLAIMCLVFLISAHKGTSRPSEAWKRCETGIRLLTKNACMENCATTCLKMLKEVVRQLNHTVDFDFESIQDSTGRICQTGMDSKGPDVPLQRSCGKAEVKDLAR
ncbi:hypothetical protein B0A52_05895 [Exophiala mesophila]|uniref:Xylanolytic transcriptional activator regulatory domain-containing protein n=1 Tax=Exophiala mesophila TaxID=212818 RepID=A0A438N3X6_EXOME|nr:hypothetical protein B0A52_05895 [Exophiala mesophila]